MQRTNARGRHTYLPEFKRWIVEQAQLSGMSLAGLAMSNQVNANQLRRWVQLHGQQPVVPTAAVNLLPVKIVAPQPPTVVAHVPGAMAVEIELHGAIVRVHDGVAPATLRMVLNCVRESAR